METAQKVNLKDLTAEQKRQLLADLAAEEKAAEEKKAADRETYKSIVVETVDDTFLDLARLSQKISDIKALVFNNFAQVIDMKRSLYAVKEGQQSHTFSNADSSISITIGYRVIDDYDDTVNSGIEIVKTWIKKQAKDAAAANLVDIINGLLKKDAKGNLKASRVLELQNHADKVNDPELSDGVRIIRDSYKPKRTSYFIEATFTDPGGKKQNLPLSITSVDFPDVALDFEL